MASVSKANGAFTVKAYIGDAKTLLAFNIDKPGAKNLAGFTIQCQPASGPAYYLLNSLQFETPADHAQDNSQPANSSINAPYRKFRWLHVPGSAHQGTEPSFGAYTYTATPRYFDGKGSLLPLDPKTSAAVSVDVKPFASGKLALGFTRGFTQSQAFVHHFGKAALIRPKVKQLIFDTSAQSGANAQGDKYTYQDEYEWLGFTARQQIFALLNAVLADHSLHLDMFAYDLNEPDVLTILLKLAAQGRIRIILDNATLHHASPPKPEDQFTTQFTKAAKGKAAILRGKFQRFAHDKIFIVSTDGTPATASKVLTGSTNFSVTGLYVNSNHVLVFDDPTVAGTYAQVFNAAWTGKVQEKAFLASPLSGKSFAFGGSGGVPKMEVTFSPHKADYADQILGGIADRVTQEGKKPKADGSVLFAVMQLDGSDSPVYKALAAVHKNQRVFSFGISDTTSGIALYAPGNKSGVLVTGKPAGTVLPPPFDQVPGVGLGHQVHHKFVVCGFNDDDAVVYCGSSNLAPGGEASNGDNLIAIHDQDVATVFAIEALGLVDHFNFLDKYAGKAAKAGKGSKAKAPAKKKPTSQTQAALDAKWYLDTDDKWTQSYFDSSDTHCADRLLFA
ncbi:MAG TPA: phospholipase D-like domain-containing protein [Rhizomicrobium sp.]|jgi:phosphatidylserine/phosphatidylglycerophosphate/cardiolipin synthase-like enzyme|nr:phospholipase D-like domain-containing protein [Rhizomicrobium sp.]